MKALSEYTKGTGRFFPRDDVQEGGLLCHLLRHINNPRIDDEALKNGGRRLPGGKWRGRHAKREGVGDKQERALRKGDPAVQ